MGGVIDWVGIASQGAGSGFGIAAELHLDSVDSFLDFWAGGELVYSSWAKPNQNEPLGDSPGSVSAQQPGLAPKRLMEERVSYDRQLKTFKGLAFDDFNRKMNGPMKNASMASTKAIVPERKWRCRQRKAEVGQANRTATSKYSLQLHKHRCGLRFLPLICG